MAARNRAARVAGANITPRASKKTPTHIPEDGSMKKFNLVLLLVALAAMTFVLAGCPKKGMMGQTAPSISISHIG